MDAVRETSDSPHVLHLSGDLRLPATPELHRSLTQHMRIRRGRRAKVTLDLSGVRMVDSSTVATFVAAMIVTGRRRGEVQLIVPSRIAEMFRICGLDSLFDMEETQD